MTLRVLNRFPFGRSVGTVGLENHFSCPQENLVVLNPVMRFFSI
jgi:hypothetical protein